MKNNRYDGLPHELAEALKRSDILVGVDQLEYFYQLYDPETGGFYYSLSSRDSEEMTPFAEGTSFTLGALFNGGMTLPDWYKEKVSSWILGHQDEGDGFFYEDLWGKITSGPRLNRDLASSVGILRNCGVEPRYPLPEERMLASDNEKETNTTLPERLQSAEKMIEYMEGLDWSSKSIWSTGQKLSSETSLIRAAGLYDVVADYVKTKQNTETGLFGEGLGWMNTNGAMKLSAFMASRKGGYANADKAIDSVIKIYGGEVPPAGATWIWNPFVLLDRIVNAPDADSNALRALVLSKGADIVNRAIDCAWQLHREDGGFAGSSSCGSRFQQGYMCGHGLRWESDLDGTLIAGQRLRTSMHNVFGVKESKDYYAKYNDEFWERLRNKPPVVKTMPRPEGQLNPRGQAEKIMKPRW